MYESERNDYYLLLTSNQNISRLGRLIGPNLDTQASSRRITAVIGRTTGLFCRHAAVEDGHCGCRCRRRCGGRFLKRTTLCRQARSLKCSAPNCKHQWDPFDFLVQYGDMAAD